MAPIPLMILSQALTIIYQVNKIHSDYHSLPLSALDT